MNDREAIARVYRRAAFGLAPGELDELERLGVDTVIDRLVDPDDHAIPAGPDDLWQGVVFPLTDTGAGSERAVATWLDHLIGTRRPFEEWMAWYWHGHLVSSVVGIEAALVPLMTAQIGLLRRVGLGRFQELLHEITIDPAMLSYLNGDENLAGSPNENYAREVLELFALGFGEFTEDDVAAGARALTGWRIRLNSTGSSVDPVRAETYFDPQFHDDSPSRYLGRDGVHDLPTVVEAIIDHPSCARFVAGRFGRFVLGQDADADLLEGLATRFRDADLDLRVLARGVLEAVTEGRVSSTVLGPMPWLLAAQRATGAVLDPSLRYQSLQDAGHLPLWPPNVGGWPIGTNWMSASTTLVRYNLAGAVAAGTPEDNPARRAAAEGDLPALADALGRPEGFAATTVETLSDLAGTSADDGTGVLTVALASPDMVLA